MSIGPILEKSLKDLPRDAQAKFVDDLLTQSEEGLKEAREALAQVERLIADLHQQIGAQDTLLQGLKERTRSVREQAPASHSERVLVQAGASMCHFLAGGT